VPGSAGVRGKNIECPKVSEFNKISIRIMLANMVVLEGGEYNTTIH